MSEKIKMKAVEITDEEIEKATGGRTVRGTYVPDNYVECKIVRPDGYVDNVGFDFCQNGCKYNGKSSCKQCYHDPSITQEKLQNLFSKWKKKHGIGN